MTAVRAAFHKQSEVCPQMGSPFMGQLMRVIGERIVHGDPVSDRVLNWNGDPSAMADSVPLRLAGALHALKLLGLALTDAYPPNNVDDDSLWDAVRATFQTHQVHLLAWLEQPPQTNEVRRSAAILAALSTAKTDQPIRLVELGTSAGLNLRADQFSLVVGSNSLGATESGVVLRPDWEGSFPSGRVPKIGDRIGIDLAPIDPSSEEGQLKLLAYLWPDQHDRITRTHAAIEIAKQVPAQLCKGDAAEQLEHVLNQSADVPTVLFHTIAWQYFPKATQSSVRDLMKDRNLVQISMEADSERGAGLTRIDWPSGKAQQLARVDFHGRWLRWLV